MASGRPFLLELELVRITFLKIRWRSYKVSIRSDCSPRFLYYRMWKEPLHFPLCGGSSTVPHKSLNHEVIYCQPYHLKSEKSSLHQRSSYSIKSTEATTKASAVRERSWDRALTMNSSKSKVIDTEGSSSFMRPWAQSGWEYLLNKALIDPVFGMWVTALNTHGGFEIHYWNIWPIFPWWLPYFGEVFLPDISVVSPQTMEL